MSKRFKRPRPISEAQRAAARANGAKSHGPVTDEGKAKAAMNALRHGLTAATLVLTTEDKPKFDELLGSYIDEYQPATQTESDLVQEITVSKWLQRRCWALQTALLDVTMDRMEDEIDGEFKEVPNATLTALAFAREANEGGALALLNPYAGRHSREWHKSIDKLRAIRKERVRNEPERVQDEPKPASPELAGAHRQSESTLLPNEPEQPLTPVAPIASEQRGVPPKPPPATHDTAPLI
jgi:hypothetical protein